MTATTYPTGRFLAGVSRPAAFAVVTACYVVAGLGALVIAVVVGDAHPIAVAFVADLVATMLIFALSVVLANASLYDPYWSVAPPVIAVARAAAAPGGLRTGAE